MVIQRIGFACKYMHPDQTQKKKVLEEIQRPLNTRSTTVQWLNRQTTEVAEQRLWDIMVHNIQAYYNLIEYVGVFLQNLEWYDLGSDVLPVYTQRDWAYYWQQPDVRITVQNESSQKSVTRQEPSMSDYRCTQANLLYLRATTPTL